MNPPFVGAGVSATILVIAFSFAVSRPCLTLKVGTLLQLELVRYHAPFFIWLINVLFFIKKNQSDDGGCSSFSQQGYSCASDVTVC